MSYTWMKIVFVWITLVGSTIHLPSLSYEILTIIHICKMIGETILVFLTLNGYPTVYPHGTIHVMLSSPPKIVMLTMNHDIHMSCIT